MDIRYLNYFVTVVNSNFNLTIASKKLHISQPALSQQINNFEKNEGIELFVRSKGRLNGLTNVGELFFENAQKILTQYQILLTDIRDGVSQLKGTVRIGIPPLILGVVFADVVAELIIKHPEIQFEIIEKGAYELGKMFILNELDIAILLEPTNIDDSIIEEYLLQEDELSAFMNYRNELAENELLRWSDLNNKLLATLDNTFMIQHKVQNKLESMSIMPYKNIMSASWDFLMLVVRNSNFITILPSPVKQYYFDENVVEKRFEKPIIWRVLLCRPKKSKYTSLHKYVFEYIKEFYQTNR